MTQIQPAMALAPSPDHFAALAALRNDPAFVAADPAIQELVLQLFSRGRTEHAASAAKWPAANVRGART